jgi:pimeloyl-ACP methyl ester carboxylesterase
MPIQKAYVTTAYGQLHYRYAVPALSSGLPTLIFLHKSASSSASMMKLMLHFSSHGYPCYAPDMPGFGSSFDPSTSTVEEITQKGLVWYSELYAGVFCELGIWTKATGVHILGHHSGAALAPQLAAMFPDIVRSICLVGPTIVSEAERTVMREKFMVPFNTPDLSGDHLIKTWNYLGRMGVTCAGPCLPTSCSDSDLELWQRELLDHVRAWKGRLQIYGAVWASDSEALIREVDCPILALCARDDVLFEHLGNVKKVKEGDTRVEIGVIGGANFSVDRDTAGLLGFWEPFLENCK